MTYLSQIAMHSNGLGGVQLATVYCSLWCLQSHDTRTLLAIRLIALLLLLPKEMGVFHDNTKQISQVACE